MNPWQTLNPDVQKDLIQPLFDPKRFAGDRSDYNVWYQKWYHGVAPYLRGRRASWMLRGVAVQSPLLP